MVSGKQREISDREMKKLGFNHVIEGDIKDITERLKGPLKKAQGSTWLISGGGGFIGGYLLDVLDDCNRNLFDAPCRVICIDNFISGTPDRIRHLVKNEFFKIIHGDITRPLHFNERIDYIVHAASIASPAYYRRHPIETIETNVWGLKNLLDLGKEMKIRSFLQFSTSEIYGDPPPEWIPTPEHYKGNVSCVGPRACYDESKRLGETLCANYYREHGIPVKTVRPFNVFGPGLKIDDKRVIPDFFGDALYRKEIKLLSSGAPTRSFCYISDAVCGFFLALLSDFNGEAFNIGNDEREISMQDLAELIAEITGDVEIRFEQSGETDYLTDNPQRRRPDLTKARTLLNYAPQVSLEAGLRKTLEWYRRIYNL
ncbi:MAG: NAD-dependent epimerase/dehydratase family protein [Bacillota bacterium]